MPIEADHAIPVETALPSQQPDGLVVPVEPISDEQHVMNTIFEIRMLQGGLQTVTESLERVNARKDQGHVEDIGTSLLLQGSLHAINTRLQQAEHFLQQYQHRVGAPFQIGSAEPAGEVTLLPPAPAEPLHQTGPNGKDTVSVQTAVVGKGEQGETIDKTRKRRPNVDRNELAQAVHQNLLHRASSGEDNPYQPYDEVLRQALDREIHSYDKHYVDEIENIVTELARSKGFDLDRFDPETRDKIKRKKTGFRYVQMAGQTPPVSDTPETAVHSPADTAHLPTTTVVFADPNSQREDAVKNERLSPIIAIIQSVHTKNTDGSESDNLQPASENNFIMVNFELQKKHLNRISVHELQNAGIGKIVSGAWVLTDEEFDMVFEMRRANLPIDGDFKEAYSSFLKAQPTVSEKQARPASFDSTPVAQDIPPENGEVLSIPPVVTDNRSTRAKQPEEEFIDHTPEEWKAINRRNSGYDPENSDTRRSQHKPGKKKFRRQIPE